MSSRNGRGKNGSRRTESEPNEAPKWITEFFKEFLSSAEYRHNLKRRILAGDANHMEILGHHYAFGNPRKNAVVNPPPPRSHEEELLKGMTKQETLELYELARKARAIYQEAERRLQATQSGSRTSTA
jgi:hypothetical protein